MINTIHPLTSGIVVRGRLSEEQISFLKIFGYKIEQKPEDRILYTLPPEISNSGVVLNFPCIYGDRSRKHLLSMYLSCGRCINCFLDLCVRRKEPKSPLHIINDWITLTEDIVVGKSFYKKGTIFRVFKSIIISSTFLNEEEYRQSTPKEIISWYKKNYPKLWKDS